LPAEASTHLPTPEGWKAELALEAIGKGDVMLDTSVRPELMPDTGSLYKDNL